MHKTAIAALAAVAFLFGAAETSWGQTDAIDLLIKDARVVDGSGGPAYRGDIAVRGDTIVRIAPRIDGRATKVVNARGKVIAPGFIDVHVHARDGIFAVPTADNYVRQGVTTLVEGPDGGSPLPVGLFLDRVAILDVEKPRQFPDHVAGVGPEHLALERPEHLVLELAQAGQLRRDRHRALEKHLGGVQELRVVVVVHLKPPPAARPRSDSSR